MEAFLGSFDGGRYSSQEKQLALRAEQLREVPSRFRLLRTRQRLVDHNQPLGDLPSAAKTRRQLGEKQTHVVMKGWLGQPLEGRLEQLRTGAILPSLDEQYRLEALCPHGPHLECVPGGEVERQSDMVIGGREITDVQRDRTRRNEQRVQQREQVILRAGIFDETLGVPPSLIAQPLQPENARIVAIE